MAIDPRRCFQVTGPPGTGKTTWLAARAKQSAEEHGGRRVVVASLTRAAAYEFQGRGLSMIPTDQIGTLHMICRRALGAPDLTEGRENDWAEYLHQHNASRTFELSGKEGPKGFDRTTAYREGDELFSRISVLRSQYPGLFRNGTQLPPGVLLTPRQRAFHELWEAWKDDAQLMDFTDLLEEALDHIARAPGDPLEMFGDEAQDWSRLEVQLFRDHWGQYAEAVTLVGDPDQAIYEWRGADPRIFLDHPVPPENQILLKQSYRVPPGVRDCALAWISRFVEDRAPVEYESRPGEHLGVHRLATSYRQPEALAEVVEDVYRTALAEGFTPPTQMVMGSCDYMLRPLLKILRSRGLPYANPYRAGDASWNPLRWGIPSRPGRKPQTTRLDRLLAFLAPSRELRGDHAHEWSWREIQQWTEPLRAKGEKAVLVHGAKATLKKYVAEERVSGPPTITAFRALFHPDHQERAAGMNLDWWIASMREKEAPKYAYYRHIIERFGERAVLDKPAIWVGTIHSFKGGEADRVYLMPDLSPAAARLWNTGQRAATARLFYVAMTRARQQLSICFPGSRLHCGLADFIVPHLCAGSSTKSPTEVPF